MINKIIGFVFGSEWEKFSEELQHAIETEDWPSVFVLLRRIRINLDSKEFENAGAMSADNEKADNEEYKAEDAKQLEIAKEANREEKERLKEVWRKKASKEAEEKNFRFRKFWGAMMSDEQVRDAMKKFEGKIPPQFADDLPAEDTRG